MASKNSGYQTGTSAAPQTARKVIRVMATPDNVHYKKAATKLGLSDKGDRSQNKGNLG